MTNVELLQQTPRANDLDQQILRKTFQRCSVLLAVLDSNLLVVPVVPSIVVRNQVVRELVTVSEEPTVQCPQPALETSKVWRMQRHEPSEVEEQATV